MLVRIPGTLIPGTLYALLMTVLVIGTVDVATAQVHEPRITAEKFKADSPEASKSYEAAAKAQNNRRFKAAVELWKLFLKDHPKESLTTNAQHYLGVCRMQAGDLPGATAALKASLAGKVHSACREDTYIDLGWVYFLQGVNGNVEQFEKATSVFEEYVLVYPTGEWVDEALHYRAEGLIQLGKLAEAVTVNQRLIDEFPDSPLREKSLFTLGSAKQDLGDSKKAIEYYKSFINEFPKSDLIADVAFRYGQLMVDQGKFAKAAPIFKVAAEETEFLARDQAFFQAAYCFSAAGDFASAAKSYRSVADICTESALAEQANLDSGRCYTQAADYGNALVRLEKSLESDDSDIVLQARHWLSRVDLAQERFENAGKEAQRGLKWIEENAPETHQMRLPLLLDYAEALEGMPDKEPAALATFVSIADEYPDSNVAPRALYRAIRLAIQIEETELAEDLTNRFTSNFSDHELAKDVKMLSADLSLAEGEPAVAESRLQNLVAETPAATSNPFPTTTPSMEINSTPQSPLGSQVESSDQLQLTSPMLDAPTSNAVDPLDAVESNGAAGPSLEQMGAKLMPPKMELPIQESVSIDSITDTQRSTIPPSSPTPTETSPKTLKFKLAHSLFLQKKYAQCVTTLTPLLNTMEKDADHANAFYFLGTSQLHLGNYEDSFKSLSNALLCNPNGKHAPQVCNRMAQALVKLKRTDDARKVLTRVILVFKDHALREQSILQLAELEYMAGNNEAALLRYREMLKEYPESRWNTRAAFGVARVAVKQGTPERALKLLDRLLMQELTSDLKHEILMLRAATLQKMGGHAAALKDLETILSLNPSGDPRSDAMLLAAPSHIATQHPGLARQCLESVLRDNRTYPHADQILYQLAWIAKRGGDKEEESSRFGALVATRPNSPLAAEANYHLGEDAFAKNRINEALPYFAAAAKASKKPELIEKSVHRLAWCYFYQRDYADAESVLRVQLERFPGGRTAQVARFLIAECLFLQSDYEAAHEEFHAISDGDGLSAKQEALVYLHGGQCAGKLKNWEAAERWLAQIHMKFADSDYAPVAYWELANVFRAQGKLDEAESAMRRTAQAGKGELAARAQYELATLARTRGRVGQAFREFQVLMYGYGGSLATAEVKRWQVKAALQAADCAAENAKNAFRSDEDKYLRQSEKCLVFVQETSPGSEEAETATRRMANLIDQFNFEPLRR